MIDIREIYRRAFIEDPDSPQGQLTRFFWCLVLLAAAASIASALA